MEEGKKGGTRKENKTKSVNKKMKIIGRSHFKAVLLYWSCYNDWHLLTMNQFLWRERKRGGREGRREEGASMKREQKGRKRKIPSPFPSKAFNHLWMTLQEFLLFRSKMQLLALYFVEEVNLRSGEKK